MNRLFLLTALLILATVGCDSVGLVEPIGDPLTIDEKSEYTGRWINSDGVICELKVSKDGTLLVGAMQWNDEKQQFVANNLPLEARRVGSAIYFLVRGDGGKGDYGILRVQRVSDSELRIYGADPAKFRAAVESGKLKGEVIVKPAQGNTRETFQVRIHPDAKSIDEVFGSEDFSQWAPKDGAQKFRRLGQDN